MPCYKPLIGWRSKDRNKSGKRSITFDMKKGYYDMPVELPCGQCIGCRLEKARQWAIRCVYESKINDFNVFITLTYNNEMIPADKNLCKADFTNFMKRLRKHIYPNKVRYYQAGEYGEITKRPHHHACLFGIDFKDKKFFKYKNGCNLYTSETLDKLWKMGHCIIGDVTFESASYIAGYIIEKITGKFADDIYAKMGIHTKEYSTMSRRPGIGKEWYVNYKKDIYPSDTVILRGKEMKPPKYFDNQYELTNPKDFVRIKRQRKEVAKEREYENSAHRLHVREKVATARKKLYRRDYNDL